MHAWSDRRGTYIAQKLRNLYAAGCDVKVMYGKGGASVREALGVRTKRGKLVDKGYLYKLLNNRTYLGMAVHKGTAYSGEHAAIIPPDLWDKVHAILAENVRTRSANTRAQAPALLRGLLFGPTGAAMAKPRISPLMKN